MDGSILTNLPDEKVSTENRDYVVEFLPGAKAEAPLMAINHNARDADLTYMVIYKLIQKWKLGKG